ncbi:MAG TPA: right-handed parallel beta-helix repeat-containing protein [Candidatus Dormibacteraeota bacterium]|nr:right-handed parallel beta-helix repeat-containing protein [Candidatus Dormibacteraeota bacterium]
MKFSTLVLWLACVSGAFGQSNSSFYVATTGNDSNPGTQSAPWRTIQHAADTARAGSTVNVRGGIYEELVSIHASGNASDGFITFRSYPGETAILDAGHLAPTDRTGVLTIHNQSYVRIEGLEIRNFRTAEHRLAPLGISVMGAGSHIELLKNNVHHIENNFEGRDGPGHGANGFGIAVYGTDAKSPITDLIIDGNEVHHLKTGSSESLVVNGNVTNFRITHNVVHDNNNIGIDVIGFERTAPDPAVDQARDGVVSGNLVYSITSRGNPAYRNDESSDGIYVDGGTRILIEQNVIHDVDFGIELASEHKDRATSYVTARNNLVYHCHTAGVSIGGYEPERGHTDHCTIVNNTLYDDDTSGTGSGEFQMQWNMADNVFANNIVDAGARCLMTLNKSQLKSDPPPVNIDHNLYYCASGAKASTWIESSATVTGFDKYVESTGNDRHSRFLDPHFVDVAAHDFHLQSDSPAIAAGTTGGVPVGELDLEGSPRVKSGNIDIGCYQRKQE